MNPPNIYKPGSAAAANTPLNSDDADEKIAPFPLEHLPPVARAMADAVVRVHRTPETLAGCCVLGILSASIGAGLEVPSHDNRTARGNLFIAASAHSGAGKSETFRPVAEPLFAHEREMVKHWEAEVLPGLQAELDLVEAEIAKLKKDATRGRSGSEPLAADRDQIRRALKEMKQAQAEANKKLNSPRLCCEDVTSQKLAVMLEQNQEQLASLSSDAGNIVNILLGQYSKLDRTDDNIYLKAWSGDNCRVDRQGREPVVLQRPCLSALWLMQPDKIETLLSERSLTDGGLIPRLLVCHTNARYRPVVRGAEGVPEATFKAWDTLVGSLIKTFRTADAPVTLKREPEVVQLMDSHCDLVGNRTEGDLRDVNAYAARWNEQAWRIAVVLHAGLHGVHAGEQAMSGDTAASAIAIADWFAGEQLRILARGRYAARRSKCDEVLSLLADNPVKGITARVIHRARITDTADEARALLTQMEAEGELSGKNSKPDGGGHTTRTFTRA